jgi:hypothetical protein
MAGMWPCRKLTVPSENMNAFHGDGFFAAAPHGVPGILGGNIMPTTTIRPKIVSQQMILAKQFSVSTPKHRYFYKKFVQHANVVCRSRIPGSAGVL